MQQIILARELKGLFNLKNTLKITIFMVVLLLYFFTPLKDVVAGEKIIDIINQTRDSFIAPIILILIYAIGTVLAIPRVPLVLFAGSIFGVWMGVLYILIGYSLGSQTIFYICRYTGSEFANKIINKYSFTKQISKNIEKNGFWIVVYLRLIPLIPCCVTSALCSVTPMHSKKFFLATLIGVFPGIFFYVYLSASAVDVFNNPLRFMYGIIFYAPFLVIIWLLKKRQIFAEFIPNKRNNSSSEKHK